MTWKSGISGDRPEEIQAQRNSRRAIGDLAVLLAMILFCACSTALIIYLVM